ncbi:sugar phosphate isomerase/epimerase family protein [Aquibacillus halophilus]|nr:sugar phosphate isomerase/epimerase family protein [Aquibacillus halophilus]
MKIGVNTWVWCSPLTTERLLEIIPKAKGIGFDAVEIAAEDWSLLDTKKIRKELEEANMGVTVCGAFGPDRDLIHEDEKIRENAMNYVVQTIQNTRELGGSLFAGPIYSAVGKARPTTEEEKKIEKEYFFNAMKKITEVARENGVTLGLEPLNRFETDFVNTVEQAVQLVDLVDHPNLGIHLDTFHMGIEEKNMPEAIRTAGHRLKHFHACENDRGTPGTGLVQWEEIKTALSDINYKGFLTIESFTPGVIEIAKAAAIWRPLETSQDKLAKDGHDFLRNLISNH